MCGFSGIVKHPDSRLDAESFENVLQQMCRTLTHRGPDDDGVWTEPEAGIGLAHNRLAVIDLTPNGHQPMQSICGRYVLVYNGEIYNFRELRAELAKAGVTFEGSGDTRVLIEAIAHWGIVDTLRKCNGMFAFALWDRRERTLFLARDRAGKKPLYYGWVGNCFVFASELKALRQHPRFENEIDRGALTDFLKFSYVPAPYSIFQGIYKVMPATMVSVTSADISSKTGVEELQQRQTAYWSAREMAESGIRNPFTGSEAEATDALDHLLQDAVACRMISDVPLGALLSGGIDSSTVVSLMQKASPQPVKTFTIGFDRSQMDEATHARAVAEYLKTDHTELYITGREALDVVPELPTIYDEPFADSSQVPTFLISKLARSRVTVALTGDGGDELFCGYRRYHRGARVWNANRRTPRLLRHGLASLISMWPKSSESRLIKFARDLRAEDPLLMYMNRITSCLSPRSLVVNGFEPRSFCFETTRNAQIPDITHKMMFMDLIDYLTDDILVKVDRASMAVSLELRNPILDYRVIEFAWRLPLSMKVADHTGKILLRRVLDRHVPRELTQRPKRGFGAPVDHWLSGALRDWAEALLSEDRLRREGLLNADTVRSLWSAFLSGKRRLHVILWHILMFAAWNEKRHGF